MNALPDIPILAILRDVLPDDVLAISEQLIVQGVRPIEMPQNSSQAF